MAGKGRPSKYTQKIADTICLQLQQGKSLRKICSAPGMPHRETVFNWALSNRDFFDQYAQARDMQIEGLLDEIMDWCDKAITNPVKVQAYKLKIDSLKWYASKLMPKKYGDRQQIEHSGSVTHKTYDLSNLSDEELKRLDEITSKI